MAELFGGTSGSGCGVVQLVGETGRELAKGREFLLLAEGALRLPHAPGEARDEDVGHVGNLDGQPPEGLGVDLQYSAGRCCPRPVDGGPSREDREPARELSGPMLNERRLLRAVQARDINPSFKYDVEAVYGGLLVEEEVPLLQPQFSAVWHQRLDLPGREPLLFPRGPRIVRGAHYAPASIRRSLPATASASSGPSTGSRTSKRVSPGSETTRMSPPWRPTTMR